MNKPKCKAMPKAQMSLTTVAQKPNQSRKLAGGKRAVIVLRLSKNPGAFFVEDPAGWRGFFFGEAKKKRR
jgi:hypothetical protein